MYFFLSPIFSINFEPVEILLILITTNGLSGKGSGAFFSCHWFRLFRKDKDFSKSAIKNEAWILWELFYHFKLWHEGKLHCVFYCLINPN